MRIIRVATIVLSLACVAMAQDQEKKPTKVEKPAPKGEKLQPPQDAAADPTNQYRAQFKRMVAEQQEQLEALVKEFGEDSDQVREMRQRIDEMERQFKAFSANAGRAGGQTGTVGPFDQAALMRQYLEQHGLAAMMMHADPGDVGRRMVLEGMHLQLEAIAARVRETDDAAAREKLTAELKEMVGTVVELQVKYRQQQIEQLEKQLAELREQHENKESVEQILARLLQPQKETTRKPELKEEQKEPGQKRQQKE